MKNLLLKLSPASLIALALGIIAIVGIGAPVLAGSTFSWLRVEDKVAILKAKEVPLVSVPDEQAAEPSLGAVVDPNNLPSLLCSSDNCSQTMVQTFIDASTTFVSIPSPFLKATSTGAGAEIVIFTDDAGRKYTSATTTVDLVRLNITGAATTSFSFACGASAGPTPIVPFALQGRVIVTTTAFIVPTSSIGIVENNVTLAQGGLVGGGTVAKIMLGSDAPYLTCIVEATNSLGFTNAANTFDGKVVARFHKLRL